MHNPFTRLRQTLSRIGSTAKVPVRSTLAGDEPLSAAQAREPDADVYENGSQFLVIVDMPGSDAKQIDVATDGKQLTIRGPIGEPFAPGHVWQRTFVLPVAVEPGKARASCALGVLRIELPKQKAELKHIRVRRAA
jgi:HSP20 family protein